jgi:protocatechuate 3,4-dioxygenase beta subunit
MLHWLEDSGAIQLTFPGTASYALENSMRSLIRVAIFLALLFGMESLTRSAFLAQDSKETGTVTGRVLLDAKPTQGVIVIATPSTSDPFKMAEQMLKPSTKLRAMTDADGRFRFEALPVGKYHIAPSTPALVVTEGDASKELTIAEAATIEDINFSLSRGAVITGKVTDSDGNPIIAEEISLKLVDNAKAGPPSPRLQSRMFYTDDRGIYRIFGLAPGRYVVSAGATRDPMTNLLAKRPKRAQTFYPGVTDEPKAKPVEVIAGAEASGIDIKLGIVEKGFTVSGRVLTAETGAPIANAMIAYSPKTRDSNKDQEPGDASFSMPGGISTTNAKGEFRLDSISPGSYKIEVQSMGAFTGASEFYADPVNIEVQSTNVDKLDIKVHLGASISGAVVIENADAPATFDGPTPFMLMAVPDARTTPGQSGMARVAADGTFRIGGLKAGKIDIRSIPYGVQRFSVVRIEHNGAQQSDGITVQQNEQITGVRVVVAQTNCVIVGHVAIQGGTLSPDSEISVWARPLKGTSDSYRSFAVDPKGNFVIENLAPGDYEVEVSVNLQNSEGGRRLSAKQDVTVNAGGKAEVNLTLNLKVPDK